MKYTIKPNKPGSLILGHLFIGPWIAMLLIGTLGHHFHLSPDSWVFHFGYWNTFIVMFLLQTIWPLNSPSTLDIEESTEK